MWLIVSFIISTYITKQFIVIPPCTKEVIFVTEFTILGIFRSKKENARGGISETIFSRPLFTVIFRPIMLILDTVLYITAVALT